MDGRVSRPFAVVLSNWPLIRILSERELRDRYAGTVLGGFWAVLQPVLLLSVLAVIFSYLFQIKRGTPGVMDLPTDYASYVIAGFVPWYALTAALQASTAAIRANAGLVKQIDFPVGILPIKAVVTQVPLLVVGIAGLILYQALRFQHVPATLLLLPLAIVLLFLLTTGLSWFLAAIGAYFRDVEPIIANIFMIAFYLLPIFFMPGFIPEILAPFVAWNPFTPMVTSFQDALVFGIVRSPSAWLFFAAFSLAAFVGGHMLFERARPGFSSVI